jgi:hypothetical protein
MSKKCLVVAAVVYSLIAIGSANAHHGTAAYDSSRTVTVTGPVSAYAFVNPHVMITINVKNASGNVEQWEGEMTSPNHLQRTGWTKNTLKIGDQVTLSGAPSKSGSTTMVIHKVLKDGQEIQLTAE